MRGSTEYCMNRYAEEISTILLTRLVMTQVLGQEAVI